MHLTPDLTYAAITEHQRELRQIACRERLAALARCCQPSALRSAASGLRSRLAALRTPSTADCCA